jgi:hypothetical protein
MVRALRSIAGVLLARSSQCSGWKRKSRSAIPAITKSNRETGRQFQTFAGGPDERKQGQPASEAPRAV